jgi:hypothetical protein
VIRLLCGNHVVANNIFVRRSGSQKAITLPYGTGTDIEDSHYCTPNRNLIENNTFFGYPQQTISIGEFKGSSSDTGPRVDPPRDNRIRNNIFSQGAGTAIFIYDAPAQTISHNLFHLSGSASAGAMGDNSVRGDPRFTSTGSDDFHLTDASPAIDSGVAIVTITTDFDGTPRPQGAGYDIGAFELSVSSEPPATGTPAAPSNLRVLP